MVDFHLNWLKLCHFLILAGGPRIILVDCMIFLSPFLDVIRMSMSAVFFLTQIQSGILCLQNSFFWLECRWHLNGFKPRVTSGPNLDLLCVRQSDTSPFFENYAKLYLDAKHLEKGLNRDWNFWCLFFQKKKVPFLANIGRCPNFLD